MLRLHRRATEEIREAAEWYDARSTGLGSRFVGAAREIFEQLESSPEQFSQLETLSTDPPIRRGAMVDGFPYIVVFELIDDDVFVIAVSHTSRRPNYWRRRKRLSG